MTKMALEMNVILMMTMMVSREKPMRCDGIKDIVVKDLFPSNTSTRSWEDRPGLLCAMLSTRGRTRAFVGLVMLAE